AGHVGVAVGLAPDPHDAPLRVHDHLPAAVDGGRREDVAQDHPPAVAGGDRARPARERGEGLAHHLGRTGLVLAGRGAAVAGHGVAVVALLAGLVLAVAARRRLVLAGRGAAVAAHGVAVVALLAGLDLAVAADRVGAGRAAAPAASGRTA